MKLTPTLSRISSAAFTLMEMMLVLLIITLIIGAVAVSFTGFSGGAEVVAAQAKIRTLESLLANFRIQNGFYPSQSQGLEALVTPPNDPRVKNRTAIAKPDAIVDPWDRKIQYRNPGKKNPQAYDVFSLGKDGQESGDDIGNW